MPDYALMNQLLFEGKHEPVKKMTEDALAEGRPAMEVLEDGLIGGMRVVGEDFKHNRIFVPEVLLAARAMKAGMAVLKPLLTAKKDEASALSATIVMGTVKGDLHDIGKNLVGMMAEGAGFTIVDLGTDTSAEKFIAAAREHNARIVGMSALLTTTMVYMRTVVQKFKEAGLHDAKICIGGAPTSPDYAKQIGADGYAADAASAVELFQRLVAERNAEAQARGGGGSRRFVTSAVSRATLPGATVTIDGVTGPAAIGQTLFDCAEAMGVAVPTSCVKQGKCRECLVEIEAGAARLSAPAPQESHLDGRFRLACRTAVRGAGRRPRPHPQARLPSHRDRDRRGSRRACRPWIPR